VRLLSYNIHGCIGLDRREDPKRVIDVIREADADIVGLQEVHSDDALDRDFLHLLETLPYRSVLYGKTMRKPNADYGNLLLLREPAENVQRIELPNSGGEPRGAIIADTQSSGRPLRVIATHLDLGIAERNRQAAALLDQLPPSGHDTPCVLMGDLNEWLPSRPYFRQFCRQFDHISKCRTFPVRPALFALDRIGLRGRFQGVRFRTLSSPNARSASDHRPPLCEFMR
jgi:endonuclease/exonuclease/phosphatase family metal-dependent hydrolase